MCIYRSCYQFARATFFFYFHGSRIIAIYRPSMNIVLHDAFRNKSTSFLEKLIKYAQIYSLKTRVGIM